MRNWRSIFVKRLGPVLAGTLTLTAFPAAAGVRVLQGESFYQGNAGPVTDSFWLSGQYKYDPNDYLDRNWFDPDQTRLMTVYGNHAGEANCVFRKRVIISSWDYRHPDIRVCRVPPRD